MAQDWDTDKRDVMLDVECVLQCVDRTWTVGNGSSQESDCRCTEGYEVRTSAYADRASMARA